MPHTGILHTAASNGSQTHPTAAGAPLFRLLLATAGLFAALTHAAPALAGPVVCTTTLEAPVANAAPVEMTRCGRVQTVPELVTRRFYSYTAPFERGVSLTNQVTDFFGIAMGGGDGSRVMGLGFPDQTIVWDGLALQNTTAVLMETQSSPLPLRTGDISPCFTTSLADTSCSGARLAPKLSSYGYGVPGADPIGRSYYSGAAASEPGGTVRGLW
jgi:hypothetical protein